MHKCTKPTQDFPAPASYLYYLSFFFKYRTFFTASQCIASALIGGKGSPQEIGASAIFTSTGNPPKGRTAFGVEILTEAFGLPSKCRCNFLTAYGCLPGNPDHTLSAAFLRYDTVTYDDLRKMKFVELFAKGCLVQFLGNAP